jgi:hypothetical protein
MPPASATIAARDSFGISLSTRRAIASIALSSSPLSRLFTYVRVLFIGWTSAAGGGIPTRRRRQPARTPEVGYSTSAMVSRSFSRLMRGTYQVSQ